MRFIVVQEKVVGSRVPNHCVKDTARNEILCRMADKSEAESIAFKANKLQESAE